MSAADFSELSEADKKRKSELQKAVETEIATDGDYS
jgi:hypothetical protein